MIISLMLALFPGTSKRDYLETIAQQTNISCSAVTQSSLPEIEF